MNFLRIRNRKYFCKLLKCFNKTQIVVEISKEVLKISSIEIPYIYLALSNSYFYVKEPIEFTINPKILEKSLGLFNSDIFLLNNSFRIIASENIFQETFETSNNDVIVEKIINDSGYSFVDVPFSNPIISKYVDSGLQDTKFLMSKNALRSILTGKVNYQITDRLIIRRVGSEIDEYIEVEVDFLKKGLLNFTTYNNWLEPILIIYDLIDAILIGFCENIMTIKILLRDQENSFIELQVFEIYNYL